MATVAQILGAAYEAQQQLGTTKSLALLPALTDMKAQLAALAYPGFVTTTGADRLADVLRYVQAIGRRIEKAPSNPQRDRDLMSQVQRLQDEHMALLAGLPPGRRSEEAVQQIRWMLEELRVSYFAQPMKTAYPISEQRILRAMDAVVR